jgi:hypothetical protein
MCSGSASLARESGQRRKALGCAWGQPRTVLTPACCIVL